MKWTPCFLFLLLPFSSSTDNPPATTQWKCLDSTCSKPITKARPRSGMVVRDDFTIERGEEVDILRIPSDPNNKNYFVKFKGKCRLLESALVLETKSIPKNLQLVSISDVSCPNEATEGNEDATVDSVTNAPEVVPSSTTPSGTPEQGNGGAHLESTSGPHTGSLDGSTVLNDSVKGDPYANVVSGDVNGHLNTSGNQEENLIGKEPLDNSTAPSNVDGQSGGVIPSGSDPNQTQIEQIGNGGESLPGSVADSAKNPENSSIPLKHGASGHIEQPSSHSERTEKSGESPSGHATDSARESSSSEPDNSTAANSVHKQSDVAVPPGSDFNQTHVQQIGSNMTLSGNMTDSFEQPISNDPVISTTASEQGVPGEIKENPSPSAEPEENGGGASTSQFRGPTPSAPYFYRQHVSSDQLKETEQNVYPDNVTGNGSVIPQTSESTESSTVPYQESHLENSETRESFENSTNDSKGQESGSDLKTAEGSTVQPENQQNLESKHEHKDHSITTASARATTAKSDQVVEPLTTLENTPVAESTTVSPRDDPEPSAQTEPPTTVSPSVSEPPLKMTNDDLRQETIEETLSDDQNDVDEDTPDDDDYSEEINVDEEETTEEEAENETVKGDDKVGLVDNLSQKETPEEKETPVEEPTPEEAPGYFAFVSSAVESITGMFSKSSTVSEESEVGSEGTEAQPITTESPFSGASGEAGGVPARHSHPPPPPNPQETDWASMSLEKTAVMVFTALVVLVFSLGHYYIQKSNREEELIMKLNTASRELQLITKERGALEEKFSQIKNNASKLTTDSEEKENKLSKLEKELKESREENKDLTLKIEKLETEIEVLMEEGTQLHSLLSEAISDDAKETGLASDLSELKESLSLALEKIEDLTKELETKTEEIHMLQLDLDNNVEKRQLLEGSLEAKKKELEEKHVLEIKEVVEQLAQRQSVVDEKNLQVTNLKSDLLTLQKKYDNLTVQYDVLEKSLQKAHGVDGSEMLTEWLDAKNIRNSHQEALVEIENLKKQVEQSESDQRSLNEKLDLKKSEFSELNEKYELAEKDKIEALTKLQVLSNYFNEKETELQEKLGLKESMWLQKQSEDHSIYEQMRMLREENLNYKSQIETLKQEILDQEASFKSRISNEEKKTHEHWVASRHAERRLKEVQMEAAQLRNRLTSIEANSDHNSEDKLSQSMLESNGEFPPPPVSGLTSPSYLGYPGDFLPPPLHHPLARPPPLGRISSPPIPADFTPPPPLLGPLSIPPPSILPPSMPPPSSFTPPSPTVGPPLPHSKPPHHRDPFPPDNSKESRPSYNSTDSPGRRKETRRHLNSNV